MRHKEIHVLNIPQLFKYVYDFCLGLVSNKLKKRVFVSTTSQIEYHKTKSSFQIYDTQSDLHKNVDPKLLPKEYGGEMPMSEMIALWKEELEAKRERLLSYDSIKLLSDRGIIRRRSKSVIAADGASSVPGSFRKLEVD